MRSAITFTCHASTFIMALIITSIKPSELCVVAAELSGVCVAHFSCGPGTASGKVFVKVFGKVFVNVFVKVFVKVFANTFECFLIIYLSYN